MIKAPKKLIKEQIELADGRYLIFYTFAPADRLASSRRADPPDGKEPKSAEEN
ncbi:MAG TPA: hypothetical protein VGW76_17190 [Pyrinomonadaceae bacterium]|nr:hypothetical protein [Pyrinomonadaceae bacterium]